MTQRYAARTNKGGDMEGANWTRAAYWLAIFTAGAVATAITTPDHVGSAIFAVVLGAAAVRCWVLGR